MNYTFADYEQQFLTALTSLAAPDGPVKTLKGFAGEMVMTEAGLVLITLNTFPAVLVEITEAVYLPGGHPFHTQTVSATLHVCSRSLRSQEEARGGEAGAYPLLHAIRSLLLGRKLAEDLQPLLLTRERKIAGTITPEMEHIMVYAATYQFTNPRILEEG
jgi:hypothetical protein